jgi:hypothetical protein
VAVHRDPPRDLLRAPSLRACRNLSLSLCLVWASTSLAQEPLGDVVVHNHQPLLLPEHYQTPALEINLYKDSSNGFNLQLLVSRYQLESPQEAGDVPADIAEGHAHLMINGKKRIRIYGEWIHLDQSLFKTGLNQLTVTLNSHQHYSWVAGRQPILATIFLDPDKQEPVQYRFSSHPVSTSTADAKRQSSHE